MKTTSTLLVFSCLLIIPGSAQIQTDNSKILGPWSVALGGSGHDDLYDALLTTDGYLLLAGETRSRDLKGLDLNGENDYWVCKMDLHGALIWQRNYGTTMEEKANAILEVEDKHYIIAGSDGLLGIDESGEELWRTTMPGESRHMCYAGDGNILVASDGGRIQVTKTTTGGRILAFFETSAADGNYLQGMVTDAENNIYLSGTSFSEPGLFGDCNDAAWLIKLNTSGEEQWKKCFGNRGRDLCGKLAINRNGEILVPLMTSNPGPFLCDHDYDFYPGQIFDRW